ncbi:hypothetical protein EVAR_61295_1 [Eumeta japonica]|uniref:Uncharacterized protein n=1 Tax=Eumeta variegata TaxID=151549 RepID=A0A4C1XMV9_EUMVA|nr:hypothetical protein EVAR_61295_1 [Eumeta japonica]
MDTASVSNDDPSARLESTSAALQLHCLKTNDRMSPFDDGYLVSGYSRIEHSRARESWKSRWLSPPIDTRKPRGVHFRLNALRYKLTGSWSSTVNSKRFSSNYYPATSSYNSVLYIHKRFLPEIKERPCEELTEEESLGKSKKQNTMGKQKIKQIKQFQRNKLKNRKHKGTSTSSQKIGRSQDRISSTHDGVIEETIKFAKELIPCLMPPKKDESPSSIHYTIEVKKNKKKKKELKCDVNLKTLRRNVGCQVTSSSKKEFTAQKNSISDSANSRRTITQSPRSNCTDDVHLNQSLCCSLSEISARKVTQIYSTRKEKTFHEKNIIHSDSFEALATALKGSGDAKLKVHLMSDAEKNDLIEHLRSPIVKSIKDYMTRAHLQRETTENKKIQNAIDNNSQKIDSILQKLSNIEQKLDERTKIKMHKSVKSEVQPKLEDLGQDLIEEEDYEDPEMDTSNFVIRKAMSTGVVKSPLKEDGDVYRLSNIRSGEASSEIKPIRSNKLPARYCWTDANVHKN